MDKPAYRLEMGGDGVLYLNHWALLFQTPEAALVDLTTAIRESGLSYDVPYYRCVKFDPVSEEHLGVVWSLKINPKME